MTKLVSTFSLSADGVAVIGITDYAQQLLGDVVFVELPPVDLFVAKGGAQIPPDLGNVLTNR
jgi:glycine cleavage system H lipoate-binding protein